MIARKTTIDQHIGNHPATGMRLTRTLDVVTEYSELDYENADDREWFDSVHAARVAIASLDAEPRKIAVDHIESTGITGDDDDLATYRAALAAAGVS